MIKIIKLLIGGSPCTHWSIAQKKNRETTASGIGWELFKNYLYAKERFKPDLFLYENNKSASQPIKDQISEELGVDLMYINSALVSAQHRQRFYAFNWNVEQPQDRGILLKDIIESGLPWTDKAYCLTASYNGAVVSNTLERKQRTMIAEPVNPLKCGKARCLTAGYANKGVSHILEINCSPNPSKQQWDSIAIPVKKPNKPQYVGEIPGHKTQYQNGKQASQQCRIYSIDGKSIACDTSFHKNVALPVDREKKFAVGIKWNKDGEPTEAVSGTGDKRYPVYKVCNGITFLKGKSYPIALDDGYYIIRKLTVKECCRLQTLPDDYCKAVSKKQAYKGLGNGWTAEVIIHILLGALKNVDRNEKIVVLSMYDGIGTGRYCLDKMGFKNVEYYAFEIDKFAMRVANDNYPDIIQCGDAFQMRDNTFNINGLLR